MIQNRLILMDTASRLLPHAQSSFTEAPGKGCPAMATVLHPLGSRLRACGNIRRFAAVSSALFCVKVPEF
jgi:hypothetical protein